MADIPAAAAPAATSAPAPAAVSSAPPAAHDSPDPEADLIADSGVPSVSESEYTDLDSSYGTDDADSALYYESVTSSAYAFPLENGRTYHSYQEGKYLFPNDEKEQDRMDMVYHSVNKMFENTLFFAPVKNPQRIADMATGTGIWAIDVGDKYKSAQVIGIDLSPIQPRWVPPNVQFRVDDIEKDWVFEHALDLIHTRISNGLAIKDWPKYLSQAFDVLKPGGWIECHEFDLNPQSDDNSFPENSLIFEWHQKFYEAFIMGGADMRIDGDKLKKMMTDAGFVNIEVKSWKWPMSPWPEEPRLQEAGAFAMLSMMEDLEGMSLASFTRYLGWGREKLDPFLAGVRREWKTKGINGYWPLYAVWGQKPEDAEA